MLRFPSRIQLARTPTPIEFMPRLTQLFDGPQIFFKRDDLTGSTLSGNKIRKLEFSLAEALRKGAKVVISAGGIQSNHCRATALSCAKLGLECHLILRGEESGAPEGNLLLDYIAGARVSFHQREYYNAYKEQIAEELSQEYAREGKKAFYIPVGASNALGSWGYVRAFSEIARQCERSGLRIDHVVVPVGSGGTLAGLIAGKASFGSKKPELWGINVCDDAPTFEHDIRVILQDMERDYALKLPVSKTPINIIDGYVGDGYAIPYPEEMQLVRTCGKIEGQVVDPVYTGKALYGLGQEIAKQRFRKNQNVLFVHTGGVFGIFDQKQFFGFSDKPQINDLEVGTVAARVRKSK